MKTILESEPLLRALADATRLRTVALLRSHGELCVCELTEALQISQPKLSRHLARMRNDQLLLARRSAQWVHYRINPALPDWAHSLIGAAVTGLGEQAAIDAKQLSRCLPDLPTCCPTAATNTAETS